MTIEAEDMPEMLGRVVYYHDQEKTLDECERNRILYAAAPELVEALRLIVGYGDSVLTLEQIVKTNAWGMARAALEKAGAAV